MEKNLEVEQFTTFVKPVKKRDSFKSQIIHKSNTMIFFLKHFLQNRALVFFTDCLPCTRCCTRHHRGQEIPDKKQTAQLGARRGMMFGLHRIGLQYFTNFFNFLILKLLYT